VLVGDKTINEGEWLSLNGSTGEVILGKQPLSPPALSGDLGTFMAWVDEVRQIKVTSFFSQMIHLLQPKLTYFHMWIISHLTWMLLAFLGDG
jgi:hypothetical protein